MSERLSTGRAAPRSAIAGRGAKPSRVSGWGGRVGEGHSARLREEACRHARTSRRAPAGPNPGNHPNPGNRQHWASPNARQGFRWVFPGGLLAVILWLIASALFALYVANFGHYNKVYGSLGGIIIFLIWMWLSNIAILFGAEFNAELIRGRAIAAGAAPDQEAYAELRDTRKLDKQLT